MGGGKLSLVTHSFTMLSCSGATDYIKKFKNVSKGVPMTP